MRTFRDFMETALYDEAEGYYPNREPGRDFYTAPELHGSFAAVLAGEAAACLDELKARGVRGPYRVVEMGSGSGRLAVDLMGELAAARPDLASSASLVLVERCEKVLLESMTALADAGLSAEACRRLEDLPPGPGFYCSNELVDALPAHLLAKSGGRVLEVFVEDGRARLGELSSPELAAHAEEVRDTLAEGARHGVSLEALAWLGQVSRAMTAGRLVTIDYGCRLHPGAVNEPRAFFRHTAGGDLLSRAGEQDLTLPVDFGALEAEGERLGLETVSYGTLGRWLLEHGILARLPAGEGPGDLRAWGERNKVKTLFHPQGMGEAFKVLVQERLPGAGGGA